MENHIQQSKRKSTIDDAVKSARLEFKNMLNRGASLEEINSFSHWDYSDNYALQNLDINERMNYINERILDYGVLSQKIPRIKKVLFDIRNDLVENTFNLLNDITKKVDKKLDFYRQEETQIHGEIGINKDDYIVEQRKLLANISVMLKNQDVFDVETPLTDKRKAWKKTNPDRAKYLETITDKSLSIRTELENSLDDNLRKAVKKMEAYFMNQNSIQ